MLLNTEELVALVNGDAEPDRLPDLLDRLERCPESAEALEVLVTLKANREEALQALREAADNDLPALIPHPAARRAPRVSDWALRGLRMAASVALVALLGIWAASVYVNQELPAPVDTSGLATEVADFPIRPVGAASDLELTDAGGSSVEDAYQALLAGNYDVARRLLEAAPRDERGYVPMGLGISYYFLDRYQDALEQFAVIRNTPDLPGDVRNQSAWYEANALLALDQPMNAMAVLEELKSDPTYPFQPQALDKYAALKEALGLPPSAQH